MSAPNTPPDPNPAPNTPPDPNQNAPQQHDNVFTTAYHGLVAGIAQFRMNRAASVMERMDHKEALYADLGHMAVTGQRRLSTAEATERIHVERKGLANQANERARHITADDERRALFNKAIRRATRITDPDAKNELFERAEERATLFEQAEERWKQALAREAAAVEERSRVFATTRDRALINQADARVAQARAAVATESTARRQRVASSEARRALLEHARNAAAQIHPEDVLKRNEFIPTRTASNKEATPRSLWERWLGRRIDRRGRNRSFHSTHHLRDRRIYGGQNHSDLAIRERVARTIFRNSRSGQLPPIDLRTRLRVAFNGPDGLPGNSRLQRMSKKRTVSRQHRRGEITGREARMAKTSIKAEGRKRGAYAVGITNRRIRRADKRLRHSTNHEYIGRWRDMRRRHAINRIQTNYYRAQRHRQ